MSRIDLGVLDFCAIEPGGIARDTLTETALLAQIVESYGYSRYWLAEHHGADAAHSSPEIVTGHVAATTVRIRVGAAGVLLHFASPLKVAKQFATLDALFPGRIDLGVARGFADEITAAFLLDGRDPASNAARYPDKVAELTGFVGTDGPQVWVLATGGKSVEIAASTGVALSLSLFHNSSKATAEVAAAYRRAFRPGHLDEPKLNVAVAGVCADTRERAEELASRHDNGFIVPTAIGSPRDCRRVLDEVTSAFGTDEVVFLDVGARGLDERARCHELLADAAA